VRHLPLKAHTSCRWQIHSWSSDFLQLVSDRWATPSSLSPCSLSGKSQLSPDVSYGQILLVFGKLGFSSLIISHIQRFH